MKIVWEIKGEIKEIKKGYIAVRLHIGENITDFFAVDIEEKKILTTLNTVPKLILKVENTFEDYMKLITDLELEIPEQYIKHWTPTLKDGTLWYYFIDSIGQVGVNSFSNSMFDNELVTNFNIFPTRELAEKAINLSKTGRLILLWQYANDCLFEPDWGDDSQVKYKVVFDIYTNTPDIDLSFYDKENRIYFKTRKQAKAFVEMYKKEIKDTMEI